MREVHRLTLLDNTVLTNFALVGQDRLPARLWPGACTTTAAFGEYLDGVAAGAVPADAWHDLSQISLSDEEEALAEGMAAHLGAGERSCLAVALARSGALASDDLPARQWARTHGIEVTDTIGILVAAVHQGYLTLEDADVLLTAMIAAGYRSPVENLATFVRSGR
jgi:predicted nucleic acid-binding protein